MTDPNCLFCKICAGEIPSQKVYEDEHMLAFRDINPQAPVHVLVVPKSHFATLAEMNEEQAELVKECLVRIPHIAASLGLESGYRLIVNQGKDAGQTVFHLHIHLLISQADGGGVDTGRVQRFDLVRGCRRILFPRAEHEQEEGDQQDAQEKENAGVDDLLHPQHHDFCFGAHKKDLRMGLIQPMWVEKGL